MTRGPVFALGGLCLALAMVVVWEALPEPPEATLPMALPGPPPAHRGHDTDAGQRDAFVAVALARPLFSQTRRPPPRVADVAVAATGDVPRLTAIMIGPFGHRAIFAAAPGGKPLVVEPGDAVGAFRVRSIEPDLVTLDGANGVRQVRPAFADLASRTPSAGAGTQPPPATTGDPPWSGLPPEMLGLGSGARP